MTAIAVNGRAFSCPFKLGKSGAASGKHMGSKLRMHSVHLVIILKNSDIRFITNVSKPQCLYP